MLAHSSDSNKQKQKIVNKVWNLKKKDFPLKPRLFQRLQV